MKTNYILITPIKNEESNLFNLYKSVIDQSIKPVLWVLIDDGSTDNTPSIIEKIKKDNEWIKSIRIESKKRDLGIHLSSIIRNGFEFALREIIITGANYEFIGNVDGDVTLESLYYEKLIIEFQKNPKLGIAGGGTWYRKGNRIMHYNSRLDEPSGGNILIRKRCYEDCLGIPITYSWDSVLKVKARLYGWETRRFEHIKSLDSRDVNSAESYWKGGIVSGKSDYFTNKHPIHILLKSINISFKYPHYIGIAYLLGYLTNIIRKNEKIDDESVRKYNWNKWRNIAHDLFQKK